MRRYIHTHAYSLVHTIINNNIHLLQYTYPRDTVDTYTTHGRQGDSMTTTTLAIRIQYTSTETHAAQVGREGEGAHALCTIHTYIVYIHMYTHTHTIVDTYYHTHYCYWIGRYRYRHIGAGAVVPAPDLHRNRPLEKNLPRFRAVRRTFVLPNRVPNICSVSAFALAR